MNNIEKGRSMIEMLGVLAIIGVLSVGGIAGYSKAMHRYRVNKAIEQITLIAANMRSFFGQSKGYLPCSSGFKAGGDCGSEGCDGFSENGCPVHRKAKIFPDDMITVDSSGKITAITNPFGHGVFITKKTKIGIESTAGTESGFLIAYGLGDNTEACIDLMSQDWTSADVKAIRLYGDVSETGGGEYFKVPADIDLAVKYCSSMIAGTSAANKAKGAPYIYFFFELSPSNFTGWTTE